VSATRRANPIIRQWIVTIVGLCAGAGIAMTAERLQGGSTECAAHDLRLVNVIEERGAAQDVSPEQLAGATFTLMRARNACRQGRIAAAMTIYDSVLLAPGFAQSDD